MDGALDILTCGENPDARRLHAQSNALVESLARLALEDDVRIRRLVGLGELVTQLRALEPKARETSWVLQPHYAYDPEDPGVELTRSARARGVETQLVTRPSTVRTHPLLSSIFPQTLLGPCFLGAMVVDQRLAIVGGPDDLEGNRTAWFTNLPEIVEAVCDLWRATLPLCEPILQPGERAAADRAPARRRPAAVRGREGQGDRPAAAALPAHRRARGQRDPGRARGGQPHRGRAPDARPRRQRRHVRTS